MAKQKKFVFTFVYVGLELAIANVSFQIIDLLFGVNAVTCNVADLLFLLLNQFSDFLDIFYALTSG